MRTELVAKPDAGLTSAERDLVAAWQDDCFGDQAWTAPVDEREGAPRGGQAGCASTQ